MINLLVKGHCDLRKKVIDEVVLRSGERIQLGLHFGYKNANFQSVCLSRMEARLGRQRSLIGDHLSKRANNSFLSSAEFFKKQEDGIEQYDHYRAEDYDAMANVNLVADTLIQLLTGEKPVTLAKA